MIRKQERFRTNACLQGTKSCIIKIYKNKTICGRMLPEQSDAERGMDPCPKN